MTTMVLARSRRRHGRGIRSSVAGPVLPLLASRETWFEDVAADAADYLLGKWPDELRGVRFLSADMPPRSIASRVQEVPQWSIDRQRKRVVIYRLPIQRLLKLHADDEWHRRNAIEGCVFRAGAEYIGRDPWEVAPDRFRHH